jgi:hypothetical protein
VKKSFREDKTEYITSEYHGMTVSYKIFRGMIVIDLKSIIEAILGEQDIETQNTKKIELKIPFDTAGQTSEHIIYAIINKWRYKLPLRDGAGIIRSKQQKIDYDNTHPHRWGNPQWLKYIDDLFYEYYGFSSMELDLKGRQGHYRRGKVNGLINLLKKRVLEIDAFHTNADSIVEYLRWVFTTKSDKTSLSLPLLSCIPMINDWVIHKKKELRNKDGKKKRKWD